MISPALFHAIPSLSFLSISIHSLAVVLLFVGFFVGLLEDFSVFTRLFPGASTRRQSSRRDRSRPVTVSRTGCALASMCITVSLCFFLGRLTSKLLFHRFVRPTTFLLSLALLPASAGAKQQTLLCRRCKQLRLNWNLIINRKRKKYEAEILYYSWRRRFIPFKVRLFYEQMKVTWSTFIISLTLFQPC